MNNKNTKNSTITLIVSCTVLIFSVSLFVFGVLKIQKISAMLIGIEKNISESKDDTGKMASLSKYITSLKNGNEKIDTYFIKEAEIPILLSQIEDYGKSINMVVDFDAIDMNKAESNSVYIKTKAMGDFKQIIAFTHYLDSLPYYSKFTRIFFVSNVLDTSADPKKKITTPLWKAEYSIHIMSFIPSLQ